MTKTDFIAKWKYEIAGRILEGLSADFKAAALGKYSANVLNGTNSLLEAMYADLCPTPAKAEPQPKGTK